MRINIRTIPHSEQRYPTVGDWERWRNPAGQDTLRISVSIMSDWRFEALVAIHELCEALLCARAGVTPKQVDEFDLTFEANRVPGDNREPGDDPKAPYFAQHQAASQIERLMSAYLGVDWNAYEKEVNSL